MRFWAIREIQTDSCPPSTDTFIDVITELYYNAQLGRFICTSPGNPDQNSQNQDSMADNEYTLISQVSATENCKTMLVQNSTTRDYAFKYFYTSWPVPNARLKSCMDAYLKLTCPHIIRIQTYIIDTAFTLITDMANGPSLRSLIIKRRIAQQWFTSTEIWLIIIQLLEGGQGLPGLLRRCRRIR